MPPRRAICLAVQDLAERLDVPCATDVSVLITLPETAKTSRDRGSAIYRSPSPGEHPTAVSAFLDHWQPDVASGSGAALRPNLILETAARGCPMFLIDADSAGFDGRRDRWLPDLTRQLLSRLSLS